MRYLNKRRVSSVHIPHALVSAIEALRAAFKRAGVEFVGSTSDGAGAPETRG